MEVNYLDLVGEGYMGSKLGRATWEAGGLHGKQEGYMGSRRATWEAGGLHGKHVALFFVLK